MPADNPLPFTETETEPAFVPDVLDDPFTISQGALDVADQRSVPPPVFPMVMDWAAGLLPFCTAENDNAEGVRLIVGLAAGGAVGEVVG